MAKIEERADVYAREMLCGIALEPEEYDIRYSCFRLGYLVGAIEQHTIDTDKACEWLKWIKQCGSSYGKFPSEESIDDFRKAMEE